LDAFHGCPSPSSGEGVRATAFGSSSRDPCAIGLPCPRQSTGRGRLVQLDHGKWSPPQGSPLLAWIVRPVALLGST
jgi:hypothetical protein